MLKITDFCVSYGNVEIIKSLNIEVGFPSVVAIIGNNGSGKSTFFNALRQRVPYQGGFLFNDRELESTLFSFLGVKNAFNFSFLARDFIRINADLDSGDECFQFLVKSLEIEDLLDKNIENLSQGQLQKCLIAQTLLQTCDVVLLDEPESHLDIKSREVLVNTLRAFAVKYQKIVFFVSHDLSVVTKAADYVINFSEHSSKLQSVTQEVIKAQREILAK